MEDAPESAPEPESGARRMWRARQLLAPLLAAGTLAGVAAVPALVGIPGPRTLTLNLGPNDAHYLSGFAASYEIDDGVGARWSRHHATLELPFAFEGAAEVALRFERVLLQPARVRLFLGSREIDDFEATAGAIHIRSLPVALTGAAPLRFTLTAQADDGRDRGLRLDWLRVRSVQGSRLWPRANAAWGPVAFALALVVLLRWGGFAAWQSLGLAAPWVLGLLGWIWFDPLPASHVTLKLLLPFALLQALATVVLRRVSGGRIVAALLGASFLAHGAALFHPRFFYPDVRTHRTVVFTLSEAQGSLPERAAATRETLHQAFRTVGDRGYAFPYSPLFYLPFPVDHQGVDGIEDAMRLAGLVAASLEVVLVFGIARLLFGAGAGLAAAALAACLPVFSSRLLLAMWPTLVGHLLDVLVIAAAVAYLRAPRRRWRLAALLAVTLAAYLTYISSLISLSLFLAALALLERRRARVLLGAMLLGCAASLLWLYWPFTKVFVSQIVPQLLAGTGAQGAVGLGAGLLAALGRLPLFFGWWLPVLALAGFVAVRPRLVPPERSVLAAWAFAGLALVALRGLAFGLFRDLKEAVFLAPLVAVLAGWVVERLWARRRWWRAASAGVLVATLLWGVHRAHGYWTGYAAPTTTSISERTDRWSPP